MNGHEFALVTLAFLSVLVIGGVVMEFLAPDRDLEANDEEPIRFAPCGDKSCRNPHPYRAWQERVR